MNWLGDFMSVLDGNLSVAGDGMPDALLTAFVGALNTVAGTDIGLLPDADLISALSTYWSLYADKGLYSLRLRYLYTQRDGLDWIRRRAALQTTFTEAGVTQSDSDIVKAYSAMRSDIDSSIKLLETQIKSGYAPSINPIETARWGVPDVLGRPFYNSPHDCVPDEGAFGPYGYLYGGYSFL